MGRERLVAGSLVGSQRASNIAEKPLLPRSLDDKNKGRKKNKTACLVSRSST